MVDSIAQQNIKMVRKVEKSDSSSVSDNQSEVFVNMNGVEDGDDETSNDLSMVDT
jgi:hypothetical protein